MKKYFLAAILILVLIISSGMAVYYENSFLAGIASNEFAEGPVSGSFKTSDTSEVVYLNNELLPTQDGYYSKWYVNRISQGTYSIRSPHTIENGIITLDYDNKNTTASINCMTSYSRNISIMFVPTGKLWLVYIHGTSGNKVDTPFYISFFLAE